jgi:sugar lactone lactonase YvrE
MKKKLIPLFCLFFAATMAAKAQFVYITNADNTITITSYTGPGGAVTVPGSINGMQVTSIGDNAFQYNTGLTSVVIPGSITSIGQTAFLGCSGLGSVTLSNGVASIGELAFLYCSSLTNAEIPESVTNIGAGPFDGCYSLMAIDVDPGNSSYVSVDGVLFNQGQTQLIEYPPGTNGISYIIPNSVTNIGDYAFESSALTNIVIGNSVANMGFWAFNSCANLMSVTFPQTVASFGEDAFAGCSALAAVLFQGSPPSSDSSLFAGDNNLTLIYYLEGSGGWQSMFAGLPTMAVSLDATITLSPSTSAGGMVSGAGTFATVSSQTITAIPNTGYIFTNWTENGNVVSTATNYTFVLLSNVDLVANFLPACTLNVNASPNTAGTVGGGGIFAEGTLETITATANSGYTFANWTENGTVVSSSASYSFAISNNVNLIANFTATPFTVYVPNSVGSIIKVTSSGTQSTLFTHFGNPGGMALDAEGNLYLAAGSVYKITPAGVLSTFATFNEATSLAFDESGNLYVADFGNGTISKILTNGTVNLFASGFTTDPHLGGNGTLTVACDEAGNVFLADYDAGTITRITPAGVRSVFANGINYILAITTDADGNVYVADFYGIIRKFTPGGFMATFASLPGYVTGLAFDEGGNLYASSTIGDSIYRITIAGAISTFVSGFSGPIAISSPQVPPTIASQPQNQGFIDGQNTTAIFNVAAGQGLAYQWDVSTDGGNTWTSLANNSTYNGATSATLTVAATSALSGYEYECIVTNTIGSATSSAAVLTDLPFILYEANKVNNTISTITPSGAVNVLSGALNDPLAFAFDTTGNAYIANQGNGMISEITPGGAVTTFASGFYQPDALAFDASGNLYVADSIDGTVSEISPGGDVSTFAGGFDEPSALAFDGTGNLYVANSGDNTVSEVTPGGTVSTFASGFGYPNALAFDGGGNLYVANFSSNTVSKVTPSSTVTTFASGFNEPISMAFDGSGNLYVANYAASSAGGTISEVTPSGTITQFSANWSDIAAIASQVALASPVVTIQPQDETVIAGQNAGFTIDVSGTPGSSIFLWLVSSNEGVSWTPLSNNSTYGGANTASLTVNNATANNEYECLVTNSIGSVTSNPASLTCLPFLMFVGNYPPYGPGNILTVTPNGVQNTLASGFDYGSALAVNENGNLYVGDGESVFEVTPVGATSTFASGFNELTALSFDPTGNLYAADEGDGTIWKIAPNGTVSTFANGFSDPTALACDTKGNVYVADYASSKVSKITPNGAISTFANDVFNPEAMAFDSNGNLYVADVEGSVFKITSAGVVSTYASGFSDLLGLAIDRSGNLYVVDEASGIISTIAPSGVVSTFASFSNPWAVAILAGSVPITTGSCSITVTASPSTGGTVSGGGTFSPNSSRTVTATANSGFVFTNWTENGNVVSTSASYNFTLTSNLTLQANFVQLGSSQNGSGLNGNYSVTESWSLTVTVGTGSGLSTKTYTGTQKGTLSVTNGSYVLIDATGAPLDVLNANGTLSRTMDSAIDDYEIDGSFPGLGGLNGKDVVVAPLNFFVIAVPTGYSQGGFSSAYPAYSQPFVGTSPDGVNFSGSGTLVDENYPDTSTGYLNEVDESSTAVLTRILPPAPKIVIASPASGQNVSNANLTITGTAQSSIGVADVWYQINGTGWNLANTGNNWANWTANVILTPGANLVQAYAVDNQGDVSTTNSANFSYILSAPLTVLTNGMGSITPPDNGALLPIGKVFSLTAKGTDGFKFVSWTGSTNGTFTVLTNGPTVTLPMVSNLVLVANLIDTNKPFISITNVKTEMLVSNAAFTVLGRATDNVAVASVNFSLNGNTFSNAVIANAAWNVPVTLVPGTNTFSAYAKDLAGNISATDTVKIFYILSATLTVQTNGMGIITPNDNGDLLQIGKTFSLKATGKDGFKFTDWTGSTNGTFSVLTNGPTVTIAMVSNLVLVANLVDTNKPFLSITNVKTGMLVSNAAFTVLGRATDNVAVASVNFSLNGDTFSNAAIASASWNASVTLVPGTNTFSAYAVDASGNISATNTVKIVYVYKGLFVWSERIAATTSWPSDVPDVGVVIDSNENCYVTGWFDDTNNFGGVTLTNHSTGSGGSDIFVAKYNSTGSLQWVQQAGGTIANANTGLGIGLDTNGNVYITGRTHDSASFGGVSVPVTGLNHLFYLAKYNNAGAIQWVQTSFGIADDLSGTGLAVDNAGNSYALAFDDDFDWLYLVKYDTTGALQWVQTFDSSDEVWGTKLALDSAGNVYVRGLFEGDMTIGSSNLVASGSFKNMFIAMFDTSGNLIWVQQATGGNVDEGGIAVGQSGNIYTSGGFETNLNFGSGIVLSNKGSFDAFVAKYNSSGQIQWAKENGAGTTANAYVGWYWDLELDGQDNLYPAGFLNSEAFIAQYSPSGNLVWTNSISNAAGSPVGSTTMKCAVDPVGHCYLVGWYQGTAKIGTNTLKPQRTWNYFLAEVAVPSSSSVVPDIANNEGVVTEEAFITNRMQMAIQYVPTVIKNVAKDQNGALIVNLAGSPYASSRVWTTTNLLAPNWQPIFTNTSTTNGAWQFIDSNAIASPTRFYRFSTP